MIVILTFIGIGVLIAIIDEFIREMKKKGK